MKPQPSYNYTAVYPMPIVAKPLPITTDTASLPGAALDLAELDPTAWWVWYRTHEYGFVYQPRGWAAKSTAEVVEGLNGMENDAHGSGHRWPGLVTSFDVDRQVIYVQYGAFLWSDAGTYAYARVR
ncbi:hypothetical protein [Streptomyces sp. NPDC004267]|uniref:hypothetical protein n=1 Tax=Streptomyces sp. NPDC004267 TaxID=3364694 RepID=UPI0036A31B51